MWLVGEYVKEIEQGAVWFYCGIFTTRDKAIAACKKRNYFIVPAMNVDEEIKEERDIFTGIEYPIKTCQRCKNTGTINAHNPPPDMLNYSSTPCPDCRIEELILTKAGMMLVEKLTEKNLCKIKSE